MKLLFIFTGGTIGSTLSGDYITTDENKTYELLEAYRNRYGFEHTYSVMTPYTELSEQNTGVTISKLIRCACDAVTGSYDGIIVTHGTDTLPYSAAALSYALGNDTIPVCVVSSNYPITDGRANGVDNLRGAVRLIEAAASCREVNTYKGVFVSYKNRDGIIYIHRASRLLETQAFSDEYYSTKDMYYGKIADNSFVKNPDYRELKDKLKPLGGVELSDVCERIGRYHLYPGIKLEAPSENAGIRCVLLEGYHSGTLNTKLAEYQSFYENMYERGIPVYLTGIKKGISYESTSLYQKLHIEPLFDISPVAAYMKLWMLISAGRQWAGDILNLPLGGDM